MSKLIIVFLSVFILVSYTSAKSMTSKEAKEILDKALKLKETRSYTGIIYSGKGKRRRTLKVFQKLNPDGSTCRRLESTFEPKWQLITIVNAEGSFEIFSGSNIVIKKGYKYKPKKYDKGIKYEIKTGYYQKIPCYIITQKIPCNEDSFAFYMKTKNKMFPERNEDELRSRYFKRCIVLKVYYIGKNDNFIYNKFYYNNKGKLDLNLPYENVNLNPVINDNVFNIPPNHIIKIAKTMKEATKLECGIIMKIMKSKIKNKN